VGQGDQSLRSLCRRESLQIRNTVFGYRGINSKRAWQPTFCGLPKVLQGGSASFLFVGECNGIFEVNDECVGTYFSRAVKPVGFRRRREQPTL
jgi:hypothetical protein